MGHDNCLSDSKVRPNKELQGNDYLGTLYVHATHEPTAAMPTLR